MRRPNFFIRFGIWVHNRHKLFRTLWNDKTAMEFVKNVQRASMDREVLKFISSRQCTAITQEQCIVSRPKDLNEWCSRCLALDHLCSGE